MNGDRIATSGKKTQFIACPACDARFTFCRNPTPEIDSSGFESYSLECKECKARLAGIIDPNGQELLLSKFADESAGLQRRSASSPSFLPDCRVVHYRE
jgi:hypothetical protein